MAKDKNVTIKFKSDSKDAQKGIDSITSKLNKLAKDVSKNPITKLSKSVTMLGGAFSVAKSAISTAAAAISDVTNAYNIQATAEKQLEAAAKNNPYLSDYSVDQLKKYASELQSISTVGDEELLPMMAQLAASGRTQNEIQDIMAASLDISASGAMSLETAVKQLNATYSGSAGKLSQMSGAVKSLTTDQLKNGEAVKILKEQYAGISKSVADSTGGWQQFKNTLGDLKETIGQSFAQLQNSAGKVLNNFFGTVIEKLQSAGKEADEFKKKLNIIATLDDENASTADLTAGLEVLKKELKELQNIKIISGANGVSEYTKQTKEEFNLFEKQYDSFINSIDAKKKRLEKQAEALRLEANTAKVAANITGESYDSANNTYGTKQAQVLEEINKLEAERANYIEKNKSKLDSLKAATKNAKKESENLNDIWKTKYFESTSKVDSKIEEIEEKIKETESRLEKSIESDKNAEKESAYKAAVEATNAEIEENKKNLDAQISAINQKYELMREEGKEYDELAKQQEILSAKESAYLELLKIDANDQKTLYDAANARLVGIKEDYDKIAEAIKKKAESEKDKKALEELKKETDKLTESARAFVSEFDDSKLSAQIGAAILRMMELRDATNANAEAVAYYNEKIKELSGLLEEVQAKEAESSKASNETELQSWAKLHEKKFQIASDFAGKYSEIMSGISEIVEKNAENEATIKEAALKKQLAAGEISQEEYEEKITDIQKEADEKRYKAQMWEWSATLLNIGAQTALGIVSALANSGNPYVGIAMAAAIGTLGAVQLAAAIANKPIPPNYASGGVVGGFSGASMGDDNTYIHARNGEMILNAMQQKAMWEQLNGKKQSGISNNVTVKNFAAGNASATPKITDRGIEIIIRDTVRKQMSDGEFDSQLAGAQYNMDGIRYVN